MKQLTRSKYKTLQGHYSIDFLPSRPPPYCPNSPCSVCCSQSPEPAGDTGMGDNNQLPVLQTNASTWSNRVQCSDAQVSSLTKEHFMINHVNLSCFKSSSKGFITRLVRSSTVKKNIQDMMILYILSNHCSGK